VARSPPGYEFDPRQGQPGGGARNESHEQKMGWKKNNKAGTTKKGNAGDLQARSVYMRKRGKERPAIRSKDRQAWGMRTGEKTKKKNKLALQAQASQSDPTQRGSERNQLLPPPGTLIKTQDREKGERALPRGGVKSVTLPVLTYVVSRKGKKVTKKSETWSGWGEKMKKGESMVFDPILETNNFAIGVGVPVSGDSKDQVEGSWRNRGRKKKGDTSPL